MEIFSEFNYKSDLSLALGFFDGVHLAHQKVIKTAVDYAKKNGTKSAVITFVKHPICYFLNLPSKGILKPQDKFKYIEDLGVDYLYVIEFEQLVKVSAVDYVEKFLVKYFSPKAITTGFNHTFGIDKIGNNNLLKDLSKKFNYEYFEIEPEKLNGEIISSTAIRTLLSAGDMEKANKMLGKKFFIEGVVVHGEKIGRTLGFKTANIEYPCEIMDLKNGVYGVEVFVDKKKYKSILNLGIRPTVSNECKKLLEVHIFDFDENIYGKNIKVEFIKKIRNEKKFKSIVELKEQIIKDIEYWRKLEC